MTERSQDFEQSMTINAPPDAVFDFVADVRNMPRYLPTAKSAEPQGGDHVRVQGEAHGHTYDDDGFLRADRDAHRLEWGSDEGHYAGQLQVSPADGGQSQVTVRLSFRDHPAQGDQDGPSRKDIEEGLRKALQSIDNHVTGKGGKEEPSAAT